MTGLRPPEYITVQVDEREKDEIPLPDSLEWSDDRGFSKVLRVDHETVTLPTADFRVKEYPEVCGIERKGSIQELRNNLFSTDAARFGRCLRRLATEFKVPILLLDLPTTPKGYDPVDLYGPQTPAKVWDTVYRKVYRMGLHLVTVHTPRTQGGRQILGYHIVRLLWNFTWEFLNADRVMSPLTFRKETLHARGITDYCPLDSTACPVARPARVAGREGDTVS